MFEWIQSVGADFYQALIPDQRYLIYIDGARVTLTISFFAIILGTLIGIIMALIKVNADQSKPMGALGKIADLYTTVIRGTPVLLQLLIMANMVFNQRGANVIIIGILCFGINSGAYVTEIIRSGIQAVDKGQTEAGRSLGFNQAQTMRYIVLPQAIKNILPALGNEFIALVKETSVGSMIAITDITQAATLVGSRTWKVLPPYFIAAAFYLVIVLVLQKALTTLEGRMGQRDYR